MNEDEVRPAKFSQSAESDETTIAILNFLLDKTQVSSEIRLHDKIPNTDGIIWLKNDGVPIGKIEVQVKTLRASYKQPSINIDRQLLAYARECQLPFIILAVDQTKNLCFWYLLTPEDARKLIDTTIMKKTESAAIRFKAQNVLPKNPPYESWKQIVLEHRELVTQSNKLKEQLVTSQELINTLSAKNGERDRNPINGNLNLFLEKLNGLFNAEFVIIKQLFVAEFWKFGVAIFSDYSETRVSYSLFSIEIDENARQIFHYPPGRSLEEFRNERMLWRTVLNINPFITRPVELAFETIWDFTKTLLERRLFWPNNLILQNEFLFYIKDKYKLRFMGSEESQVIELLELKSDLEEMVIRSDHETRLSKEFPEREDNLFRALDYIQNMRLSGLSRIERMIPSRRAIAEIYTHVGITGTHPKESIDVLKRYYSVLSTVYADVVGEIFPMLKVELVKERRDYLEIICPIVYSDPLSVPGRTFHMAGAAFVHVKDSKRNGEQIFEPEWSNLNVGWLDKEVNYLGKNYELVTFKADKFVSIFGNDSMLLRSGVFRLLRQNLETYFESKGVKKK